MYTVFMAGNSSIYRSGFSSWSAADRWGRANFGPGGYEVEQEF